MAFSQNCCYCKATLHSLHIVVDLHQTVNHIELFIVAKETWEWIPVAHAWSYRLFCTAVSNTKARKCQIVLSDLNQIWNFSEGIHGSPPYKISENLTSGRHTDTCSQTDWQKDMTGPMGCFLLFMQTTLKVNFPLHRQHDTCPSPRRSVSSDRNSIGIYCEKVRRVLSQNVCWKAQYLNVTASGRYSYRCVFKRLKVMTQTGDTKAQTCSMVAL